MGALAAAPEIAETVELMTAPPERECHGSIFYFRELQPTTFSGVETPLQADQWIVDMDNLLRAARIPPENRVDIVKIQLKDVARAWWLAEEPRLEKPVTWKAFSESFYAQFFPATAQREMEQKFIELKQGDQTVDEYANEFLRLSRFAPRLVTMEEDRAYRFQQGLKLEIQQHLAIAVLETFSGVLEAAQ